MGAGNDSAPAPLPNLKPFDDEGHAVYERWRSAMLGSLFGHGPRDTVPYLSEDQSGTQVPPPELAQPWPAGVLPPVLHLGEYGEGTGRLPPGWARYEPKIREGHTKTIEGVAGRMLYHYIYWQQQDGVLSPSGSSLGEAIGGVLGAAATKLPEIGRTKPPWWDYRASTPGLNLPEGTGPENERIRDTLMMMRDNVETNKWIQKHIAAPDGSYAMLLKEMKKDHPDEAKVKEYVRNLEYARYMIAETKDLTEKVLTGKRPVYSAK